MIIENSRIPELLSFFINIKAITIYPWIFFKGKADVTTISHEKIHLSQQRELWLIGFYVLYLYYWLKYLRKFKGDKYFAYVAIPFEMEAYTFQADWDHYKTRPRFFWKHYTQEALEKNG